MASSESEYRAWASDKQTVLAELCVELEEATETHLQLLVSGGGKLQICIPSRYQLGLLDSTTDSNEVFLVLTMGDVNSKMEASVLALNERLEQIRVNPNALHKVLDLLLIALKKLGFKRSRRMYEDGKSEVEDQAAVEEEEEEGDGGETGSEGGKSEANYESDDEGDVNASCYDIAMGEVGNYSATENELRMRGSLHALAEEARKVCEDFQRGSARDMKNPLMWFRVLSKPMMLAVELQFEVVGMIDERIAAGLGFSLDAPVSLTLEFSKNTWSESSLQSEGLLKYESVTASQHSVGHNLPPKTELDDINRFLEASGGDRHRSYGLEVLFPELTSKFFANLNQEAPIDDVHLEGFEYDKLNKRNPFICLAQFISLQLRLLPGWCLVCWKKLPFSVTRMRTCNDDLCLYRFEELGLGVSVLDEMKNNPTLVEVDISLAVCAAQSARDVFEPFPAFLLERQEIRGRSGWFSNNQGTNTTAKIGNKRFDLLTRILSSIPPIDILKKCTDERALKKALTRAWYLHKYANFKLAPHGGPVGDNAAGEGSSSQYQHKTSSIYGSRKIMEPTDPEEWKKEAKMAYDLTRFILMTNRLSLSLLSAENEVVKMVPGEEVQNRGIQYQFVVLHDAPEKEAYFTRAREEHGSFFAFHGSPAPNWYSILRNGLRSMSNTGYMSTGAAYGEGIYLATELNTSLVYARATAASWNNGTLKEGFQCIAICEVINGSPRESKPLGAGILVVPRENEQNVAIRYLMVLQPKLVPLLKGFKIDGRMLGDFLKNPSIDLLHHYQSLRQSQEVLESTQQRTRMLTRSAIFLHALAAEESHVNPKPLVATPSSTSSGAKSTGKLGSRAVMQEFNNLMKAINKSPPIASSINKGEPAAILSGTTVTIPDEDNNLSLWRISLHPYLLKESPNLYNDFTQLKRLRKAAEDVPVELEVKFPVNFPFEPPFVRVLSPRFKMHSGHVTVGGSICMELLTASGWSPACNFESLLVQVVMAFVEGEGRLDIDASIKGKNEYKESEAREAFLRAARAHGWKTT